MSTDTITANVTRVEFTPYRLARMGAIRVDYDEQFSSVAISIDGQMVATLRVLYQREDEGRLTEGRHTLVLAPYRTDAEWDEGPTVIVEDCQGARRVE